MSRTSDYLGNGLGGIPLGSPNAATLSAFPAEEYQSPLLDFTVPNLGVEIVPAKPGYVAVRMVAGAIGFVIEQVAGTQTTPMTMNAGSDPAHTNIYISSTVRPANADVNTAVPPSIAATPTPAATTVQLFPNAPIVLDITAGAQGTGGFTLKGRFLIRVQWIPVG